MGTIPKVSFDDFYKFILSIGIFLLIALFAFISYLSIQKISAITIFSFNWEAWVVALVPGILSIWLICWAGRKWRFNQNLVDEKLKIGVELMKQELERKKSPQQTIIPPQKQAYKKTNRNSAVVEYRVDSVLPGTALFNLIKDGKVWFWIANLEDRKYLAYIKIKLKIGNYEKFLEDKYYGGKESWKLNAYTGIHAPGMPIPPEVIERVKKGEILDITINCEVKDENNKLVEKKLPVTYGYNPNNNTWYLEP